MLLLLLLPGCCARLEVTSSSAASRGTQLQRDVQLLFRMCMLQTEP